MGTPNEDLWPEAAQLPYFRPDFPVWPPKKLELYVPRLQDIDGGIDLLEVRHVLDIDCADQHNSLLKSTETSHIRS